MSDLVTFVRARLDEDERLATALPETHRAWRTTGGYPETGVTQIETADGVLLIEDDSSWAVDSLPHIARHDPARVLRDVEAKRALLELHEYATAAWALDRDKPNPPTVHLGEVTMTRAVLQLLALPYADHPDYRQEWAA